MNHLFSQHIMREEVKSSFAEKHECRGAETYGHRVSSGCTSCEWVLGVVPASSVGQRG